MKRAGLVAVLVVVVGVVAIVLRGRCDEGQDLLAFPYTFEVAPGNYLFVDGHEFHGEVVCAWEPGDSVRIAGIPVLPARPVPRKERTEEELREKYGEDAFMLECVGKGMTWNEALHEKELKRRYGGVPFVEAKVESGTTWHDAVVAYSRKVDEVIDGADMDYWEALEAGASKEEAMQAALDSLDRSLLDPSAEVRASESGMSIQFEGRTGRISFFFHDNPPWEMATLEEIQMVNPEKASGFIRSIARSLGQRKGSWMVVLSDTEHATLAGRAVTKALRQIEEAEEGIFTVGPLPERELKLVLMARRVKIDGTDD